MRKASCCFIFLLFFAIQGVNVLADTYSWKDESGTIHFTDRPENIPPKYRQSHRVQKNDTVNDTPPVHRHSRENVSATPSDIAPGAQGKKIDFAEIQKLAEQGDTTYHMRAFVGPEMPRDYNKAMEWYHKVGGQGNAYGQGQGVPRDAAGAMTEWYRKVDGLRNAYGQGLMHDISQGGPRSMPEAMELLRKAAERNLKLNVWVPRDTAEAAGQGNAHGQSFMYDSGQGMSEGMVEAMEWYLKAVEQGNLKTHMFNIHDSTNQ